MDDDAGALFDHRRQQRAIEAYGGEQLVERLVPFVVVEYGEAGAAEPPTICATMSMPPRRSRTALATAAHPSTVEISATTKCSAWEDFQAATGPWSTSSRQPRKAPRQRPDRRP